MQESWSQAGFHPDFRSRPEKPGNLSLTEQSVEAACSGDPQEVRDVRNMECLLKKVANCEWSPPMREDL